MTIQQHVAAALAGNLEMLKATLADFSDADMLIRPLPNANHAAWQIGHAICSETRLVEGACPGAMPKLPEGFAARFTRETATLNEPSAFATRADLLAVYATQRAGTIAWAKSLTDSDLDAPAPERVRAFIPTIAALLLLIPSHLSMHIGQIQVIRRKLGKPILM